MADPRANLKPWPKGVSGNPKGRPRQVRAATDVLGAQRCEALLRDQYARAMAGDASAAKTLIDRIWPALARTELSGLEGKPIAIEKAEAIAAALPDDVLAELDAMAERMNVARGNGAAKPNGSGNGVSH